VSRTGTTFSRWPNGHRRAPRARPLSSFAGADLAIRRGLPVVYLLIGTLVADQHRYFTHLGALGRILVALLAVTFWPLVLLGVQFTLG
jgi:hypothetical protein